VTNRDVEMDIERLPKALIIMNKDGKSGPVNVSHDELHIWPMTDKFTADEVEQLKNLDFRMNDEGGFDCFV